MSESCGNLPGWGSIGFGSGPWVGTVYASTTLPTYPPFDVFCLGPCGSLYTVQLYPEVEVEGGGQWAYDADAVAVHFWSGASALESDPVRMDVYTPIPDQFSAEWVLRFDSLPADFTNAAAYAQVGVGSKQGYIFGLAFSQIGLAIANCPGDIADAELLPGSSSLVSMGDTYVVKVVVSSSATYLYVTEYADYVEHGHRLRYMRASVSMQDVCPALDVDVAWVRLDGEDDDASRVSVRLSEFCVSSRLLITDFPPVADAGADQAVNFCSIVSLDGSASADPEGTPLQYSWRLLDAPVGSGFAIEGLQGASYPLPFPTGYTDKWYADVSSLLPGDISAGDVLMVDGAAYTIASTGTDGLHGTYVQITAQILPDSLSLRSSKVLRQFGISGPNTAKASFYPDIPGFYRFDLTVFDGAIWSPASTTVVNVTASSLATGVLPETSFIWEYLSDFWKLVDDKQRYSVVWSGLAQFCAGELLNLWQYEYSKSLRDIQRTFQRKWMDYSLRYLLPRVATPLRVLYEAYDSEYLEDPEDLSALVGKGFTITVSDAVAYSILFESPGAGTLTAALAVTQLQQTLPSDFVVTLVYAEAGGLGEQWIRVVAPYAFSVTATSSDSVFPLCSLRGVLRGWGGARFSADAYAYQVNDPLTGYDIRENDFLCLDGLLYRIVKLGTSGTKVDDVIYLKDPLPAGESEYWSIPSYFTHDAAFFYSELVSEGDDVVVDVHGTLGGYYYKVAVAGVCATATTAIAVDPQPINAFVQYASSFDITLLSVYRRKYVPVASVVAAIPTLQQTIAECPQEEILRENLDYFLEFFRGSRCIRFDTRIWVHDEGGTAVADTFPPITLWAEMTFLDNRPVIEANFGAPVALTLEKHAQLPSSVDYLSAVRGLWHSYFNGPRISTLRVGAQILLGLPFVEEDGTIEEIRTDFSPNSGRLLIRDAQATQVVRSYTYPVGLSLETNPSTGLAYAVGDTVKQFAPLVKGVELLDYVSDTSWLNDYAAGGGASVLQRFFRFLVRVEYGAFNLAALTFVKDFILKVKPTYAYPIFAVLFESSDSSVDVADDVLSKIVFSIYDTPMEDHNVAAMWDQPEDGSDGLGVTTHNAYDRSQTGVGVDWGHDRIAPATHLECTMCTTFLAPTYPLMDAIFAYDLPVYDPADPGTPITWAHDTQLPAGTYCRDRTL